MYYYTWRPALVSKTVIFSEIVKGAAAKGSPCIVLTRGRKIVDQASQRLLREKVEHGVLMSQHWLYRPHLPIQVVSVDTVISRKLKPPAKIIVIDECHLASSKGYKAFLEQYPDAFILAVTATPYGGVNMRHFANKIIKPINMLELIRDGYLVPGRFFCPYTPDLTDVRISKSTKDYDTHELNAAMDQSGLVGDIVSHWQKLGENRPTIAFAVTVEHSKHIRNSFLAKGIPAEHLDANSSDTVRNNTLNKLKTGEIKVVSNVGILTTGLDIPEASCGIMARPTRSYNLYIQCVGRFTRPAPNKNDFIILDHAGAINRHNFPTVEPEASLDGKQPKIKADIHVCPECFAAFRGANCPHCGKIIKQAKQREILHVDGELKEKKSLSLQELNDLKQEMEMQTRQRDMLLDKAATLGFRKGWVFHSLKGLYGEPAAKSLMRGFWK